MIADKRKFTIGVVLLVGFFVVFVLLFMPLFDGNTALDELDTLYNSISKGSAHYIPDLRAEARNYDGMPARLTLTFPDEGDAQAFLPLLEPSGATGSATGPQVKVAGDLGRILQACLADAEDLYANAGTALRTRHATTEERLLGYRWWLALGEVDKDLKRQEKFAQAKFVSSVRTKAVECAYNYYGIVPEKITDRLGIVLCSLAFYVVYTIWYGFAVLFLFEGWGLRLAH